jgi:hypothetical protein
MAPTPEGGTAITITAAGDGAVPAAGPPAEPLSTVSEPAAVPVELWVPVEVGGGDVVMLCQFTEQQIGVLRVRADETGMSFGELLSDVFMRMCDNAWA